MPMKRSTSSAAIEMRQKVTSYAMMLRSKIESTFRPSDFESLFADVVEYEYYLRTYAGQPLGGAKLLEIGVGPRALRLMTVVSMGADARGVDLDVPLLTGALSEIWRCWRANGFERVVKSIVRFYMFDLIERRRLAKDIRRRGGLLRNPIDSISICDAADLEIPSGSLDLIWSEGTFEHIEPGSMERLLDKMPGWLKPNGIALIRPCIFTGIIGGHLMEWQGLESKPRLSEPWEHLRKNRFHPNVYINKFTRSDFRRAFVRRFEIILEQDKMPRLGEAYLTPEVRAELAQYTEEDLFSNLVLFVLRPLQHADQYSAG
jgi:hypothetical protein